MLALVGAAPPPATADALTRERSWELRRVRRVSAAVAEMPPAERRSVGVLIVEAEPVNEALLSKLSGLGLIACVRGDPINVDVAAATARGAVVVHAPGRNAEAVADFTLGLCLAAMRSIALSHHEIVSGSLTSTKTSTRPAPAVTPPGDVVWLPDDPGAPIPYLLYRARHLSALTTAFVPSGPPGTAP